MYAGRIPGMYASHGFLRSDIGDVDVIFHDGLYHLFHLVLPNHDFIAHAVSEDGLSWRRVKNALFVGDPGSWDDDMLWTMHVSPDPDRAGEWRMFYTGLSRAEYGRIQRVGLARSKDLYHWERCTDAGYPLEIRGPYYESGIDEGRQWVSFRDPFFFIDEKTGSRLLLASGRVRNGPVIRRGCVAMAREIAPDSFEFLSPLHKPGLYDDVEVPNLSGSVTAITSLARSARTSRFITGIPNGWRDHTRISSKMFCCRLATTPRVYARTAGIPCCFASSPAPRSSTDVR